MGRSTNGKVVTTNVSTSKIRDVFNTDKASKPISQTGRKASDFFTDGEVDNSINNNFIDADYCPVDDGEGATKKDRFIRNPKSWGHWRNYGGEEIDEGTGYPYIYWKNVIDQSSIDHIDNDLLETYNIIPTITMFPNKTSADINLSSNIVSSKNLASSYQSAMFSGNKLIDSILATKVGIDYGIFTDGIFSTEAYTGIIPNFNIKVTPRIIDSNAPITYIKRYIENGEIVLKEYSTGASITAMFSLPVIFAELSSLWITLGPSNPQFWTQLWDWFAGPNSPLQTLTRWPGWNKIATWFSDKLLSGPLADSLSTVWAYLGPVLIDLAIIVGIVMTIDMIWDLTNPEADITDALYQYAETVSGNYIFQDINKSNYKFSFGNKSIIATGTSNGYFSKDITLGGYSHPYDLEDFNFEGTPFSSSNLISEFPTNDSVRAKYLNIDFLAQLQQFDLQVPPPVLEYKVELVPISGCTLHPTKTSAFIVRIVPEKYLTPNFSINTSMNNLGKRELYWNSSISFNNARYADFIYLKDTQRNSDYWLNLFGDYNNIAINTAINETSGNTNPSVVLQDYGGNNLVATGSQLYFVPHTQVDAIPTSEYEVYFMRETSPNILFNPYFRTEQDENNLLLATLRSFWDHSLDITVGKGVAVKNDEVAATTYLQQSIPRLIPSNNSAKSYYVLQIGINKSAGNIYLNTSSNFQTMAYLYQLCPDDGFLTDNFDRVPIDGGYRDKVNYFSTYAGDYGISYSTDKIEFLNSGNYFIVLEVVNTPEKILKFEFSSDFSGYITHCKLQNLPRQTAGTSGRNATNMLTESNQITPKFTWMSDWLPSKLFTLYFDTSNPYSTNVTVNLELLKYLSNKDVFGGQKVLTTVERVNVKYIFDNNTDRNVVDDDDYYMPAEENYTGQSIENETLALTYDGDIPLARMEITLYIRKSNYNTNLQQIVSLESGNIALVAIKDFNDCLLDSDITLHNTSLGQSYGNLEWGFSYIPTRLNSLDISNNVSIKDNVENITYIDNTFKAANTGITGDLSSIISIPNLYLNGVANLTYYGIGEPQYENPNTEPHIEWTSSNIQVEYLNNLVKAMTLSGMYNGYLDIKGSNPDITDTTTLANIGVLIDRGWTVLYNDAVAPVITLNGAGTIELNVGDTYTELGATASDNYDEDITSNIVITGTVDTDTAGTYSIYYNVADSSGNDAVEVVRVISVIVDTSLIMEFNMGVESLTIPFYNTTGYNCTIDWGDGSALSTITSYNDADRVHAYSVAGVYAVKIKGSCKGIYFNNSGDKTKLINITSWGVTGLSISYCSFYGCSNLVNVEDLPNTTSLPSNIFRNCTSLTSIILPTNLTSIGFLSFYGCTNLNNIDIPYGVISLGDGAFEYCTSFTNITMPNSITSLGNIVFGYCTALTNVTFSTGLTNTGTSTFARCGSLNNVIIPNNITTISSDTFDGCKGLTNITLHSNIVAINSSAFMNCTSLSNFEFPPLVSKIDVGVFAGCTSFMDFIIPNSVTSIEKSAFSGCNNLSSITIPNSVISIGNYAFAFDYALTEITIPNSVTTLGEHIFEGCRNLVSASIGTSVISMGTAMFNNCDALTTVIIKSSITVRYLFDTTPLLTLSIESPASSIIDSAFLGYTNLIAITMPSTLTNIGAHAFSQTGLTSITFPENIITIPVGVCSYASNLTSIIIPSTVTAIGEYAFNNCNNSSLIYIINSITPPIITSTTFQEIHTNARIKVPAESVTAYKEAEYWSTYADQIVSQ